MKIQLGPIKITTKALPGLGASASLSSTEATAEAKYGPGSEARVMEKLRLARAYNKLRSKYAKERKAAAKLAREDDAADAASTGSKASRSSLGSIAHSIYSAASSVGSVGSRAMGRLGGAMRDAGERTVLSKTARDKIREERAAARRSKQDTAARVQEEATRARASRQAERAQSREAALAAATTAATTAAETRKVADALQAELNKIKVKSFAELLDYAKTMPDLTRDIILDAFERGGILSAVYRDKLKPAILDAIAGIPDPEATNQEILFGIISDVLIARKVTEGSILKVSNMPEAIDFPSLLFKDPIVTVERLGVAQEINVQDALTKLLEAVIFLVHDQYKFKRYWDFEIYDKKTHTHIPFSLRPEDTASVPKCLEQFLFLCFRQFDDTKSILQALSVNTTEDLHQMSDMKIRQLMTEIEAILYVLDQMKHEPKFASSYPVVLDKVRGELDTRLHAAKMELASRTHATAAKGAFGAATYDEKRAEAEEIIRRFNDPAPKAMRFYNKDADQETFAFDIWILKGGDEDGMVGITLTEDQETMYYVTSVTIGAAPGIKLDLSSKNVDGIAALNSLWKDPKQLFGISRIEYTLTPERRLGDEHVLVVERHDDGIVWHKDPDVANPFEAVTPQAVSFRTFRSGTPLPNPFDAVVEPSATTPEPGNPFDLFEAHAPETATETFHPQVFAFGDYADILYYDNGTLAVQFENDEDEYGETRAHAIYSIVVGDTVYTLPKDTSDAITAVKDVCANPNGKIKVKYKFEDDSTYHFLTISKQGNAYSYEVSPAPPPTGLR